MNLSVCFMVTKTGESIYQSESYNVEFLVKLTFKPYLYSLLKVCFFLKGSLFLSNVWNKCYTYVTSIPIISNSWVRDGPSGRTQHYPQDELCPHLWSICNNRYTYTCIACNGERGWGDEGRGWGWLWTSHARTH